MRTKHFLIILLCLFSSQLVVAQETVSLPLSDAIETAIANNKNIKAAALEREINNYKRSELYAAFYPTIKANTGITHYIDLPTQFLPATFLNPEAPADQVVGVQFGVPNSSSVGVSAQWMLYNQAIFSAKKMLKIQTDFTEIQIEKDKNDLAYSVTQLYYGIAFGKSQRDILTENLGSLDKLLNIIESNYRNGLVKKIDVEKVKINKSNLASELENLEMVISSQKNIFKILLDLPLTDDIKLLEKFDGTVLNYITVNNPSAESTTDYRMLQKQLELTQKERSSIKSAYFPTVGLNYNYSYNWQSQNLGDLYGSNLRFPQQLIGLNVNIPIFDGRQTEFKLKQNKVKAIQLEQKTSFVKTKIEADIENAQLKYNQNVNAISTRQQNVNLAKSVYDQSVFEYREGVSSLTEVINSETALRTSQTQYLSSVSNALMALLEYKKATGSIMSN